MAVRRILFVSLLTGAIFLAGYPAVRVAGAKAPAEPAEVQRLVEQLGSDHFPTREAASRKLLELGEAALPALQKALQASDAEVRRRSEQLVAEIKGRAEDRAIQRLLVKVNQAGLDQFITRMIREEKFATDERWEVVVKLAQAVAARATEVGGKRFHAPDLDISQLKVVRERRKDRYAEARVLVDGLRSITSVEDCVLLSSGPIGQVTSLSDSIVIVNGDIGYCTSIDKCIVLCRGNIDGATSVTDSVILATGRFRQATGIDRSLLQVSEVEKCTSSPGSVFLNLAKSPAVHPGDERCVPTERGPLQMLRFSAPAAPGGKSDRPPGK